MFPHRRRGQTFRVVFVLRPWREFDVYCCAVSDAPVFSVQSFSVLPDCCTRFVLQASNSSRREGVLQPSIEHRNTCVKRVKSEFVANQQSALFCKTCLQVSPRHDFRCTRRRLRTIDPAMRSNEPPFGFVHKFVTLNKDCVLSGCRCTFLLRIALPVQIVRVGGGAAAPRERAARRRHVPAPLRALRPRLLAAVRAAPPSARARWRSPSHVRRLRTTLPRLVNLHKTQAHAHR